MRNRLLEGQAEQLGALPWPERFPLPAAYRLVAWQAGYTAAAERLGAPPELQAATRSPLQEPAVSLALLAREALVGWLIVDRTGPASMRYSSLFVAPGHRGRGQGLCLMVEGFRRQAAAGIPLVRFAVAPDSQAMLRLVQRHLRDQLSRITIARASRIQLSSVSGTEG